VLLKTVFGKARCTRGVMVDLILIAKKNECTGCGACASICPVGCISLIYDNEGFAYPEIGSECIDCGKCNGVCPVLVCEHDAHSTHEFRQCGFAGYHRSPSIWGKSSSGGAFSALCKSYCDVGDGIFGAKFEGSQVIHDCVYTPDEIEAFQKSKYVQSDMGFSYSRAKKILESGRKVLFSGTPCQVAGLKSYLKQEYDNLLCIDLICHGVGSPGVFKKYIEWLETQHSSKMLSFTFRNKKAHMGRFLEYIVKIEFENGIRIENKSDPFNTAFIQGLFLRPSCGKCIYANMNRVGDITIGDFKKQHELLPREKRLGNMSTIIVNTQKGLKAFEKMNKYMVIFPVNLNDIVRTNNPLRQASKMNKKRDVFYHDLAVGMPINQALKRNITVPNLINRVWVHVPCKARAFIKRSIQWIKR
jgi:coenzyme F420-reducing hydrogenase beta subunit